ncbi:MAG TPA: helix-turn-helix domain-containing protein [Steroidobacteraceae bacterium]|nr:helix-turn-helix domain-containing protein [Steroidobacteraceae bacterium]
MSDRSFEDWLADQPADVVAAADRRLLELVEEIGVGFVREALGKTQSELARKLGRTQAYVSKLERQSDMLLSTLKSYVQAAGGDLQLKVTFSGGEIAASSLGELAELQAIAVYPAPRPGRQLACHENGEVTHYGVRLDATLARPAAYRKLKVAPMRADDDVLGEARVDFAAIG